jgi:hypothetical protein
MSTKSALESYDVTPMDRLIGRRVVDREGRAVGRIEEFRVQVDGVDWMVTDYVIGVAGVLERFHVGFKLVLGRRTGGYVARADQVDATDENHIRVTCRRDELREI